MNAIDASNRDERLAQMQPGNAAYNGQFLFGVRTTGVYCLPSCRARRAKPENIVFFDREAEAVAFGLRACRKCRPDYFYQNHDPNKEAVKKLAREMRAHPDLYGDAETLTEASHIGATKLYALFRQHYHMTPQPFLRQARIHAACEAFAAYSDAGIVETALSVGYTSASAFHVQFKAETGLSPGQYRDFLHGRGSAGDGFALSVSPVDWKTARRIQCRDVQSLTEKATEGGFVKAFWSESQPVALHFAWNETESAVTCRIAAPHPMPAVRQTAHRVALRLLGLGGNTAEQAAWEDRAQTEPLMARLIGERRGMRVPLTASVWESAAWAIIGQQINLPFAYTLRRALTQITAKNEGVINGLMPFPTAAMVAGLNYADLSARQFSRRKVEYLIDTARLVVSGALDLDALAWGLETPLGDAEKTLLAVRGFGPWTAHYVLMRGGGWPDCVPIGDTGVTAGLKKLYDLDHAPDKTETARLMEPFAPFRSLATHHLWASLAGVG